MPCNCACCCGCCCDGESGSQTTPASCESPKSHKGNGTSCGVCCVDGEVVSGIESAGECEGFWVENGKCKTSPCLGACCDPVFGCSVTTRQDCLDIENATFLGEGTTCSPNPCTPNCDGIGPGFEQCGDRNCCLVYCDGIYDDIVCETCVEVTDFLAASYGYADADEMCNEQLAIDSPCYMGNELTLHVCRDDCVFTYCMSSGMSLLSAPQGPGTELKKLLAGFPLYIKTTPSCPCNKRAMLMDKNEHKEPGWCEKNLDTIVGWLKEEHVRRKILIPFSEIAVKQLVRMAIRRAKKANSQ